MDSKIKTQEIGIIGKIIIPKEIENMIDFLHKSIGATEWSGILFYKMIGGDMNKLSNLEFNCEFLYPMNIGSSTYTEFDYSSEVMNAYDLSDGLIECSNSLIHSHHSMASFFSGIDTDELLANCKNFNYYISLIVNFAKEYKCKIAFPSKTKNTFEHTIKNSEGELITAIRSIEEECIIIGELTIEFENVISAPEWLNKRVKDLKVKKATPIAKPIVTGFANKTYPATIQSYIPKDYEDFGDNYEKWYNKQPYKQSIIPTPKQFLASIMNISTEYKDEDITTSILLINDSEVTAGEYSVDICDSLEDIHDELYGSANLFDYHCKQALRELEKSEALFPDVIFYQLIKENLEIYA